WNRFFIQKRSILYCCWRFHRSFGHGNSYDLFFSRKGFWIRFQTDVAVDITMISKDNYLLFTPMLHEIASGMIETRHIVTPIRTFCNRSRFYCADVESIDLGNKSIEIRSSLAPVIHSTQDSINSMERNSNSLHYDYL